MLATQSVISLLMGHRKHHLLNCWILLVDLYYDHDNYFINSSDYHVIFVLNEIILDEIFSNYKWRSSLLFRYCNVIVWIYFCQSRIYEWTDLRYTENMAGFSRNTSRDPLMHMSQNGQMHFKNLAAFAATFLKCVWPFWDIMH